MTKASTKVFVCEDAYSRQSLWYNYNSRMPLPRIRHQRQPRALHVRITIVASVSCADLLLSSLPISVNGGCRVAARGSEVLEQNNCLLFRSAPGD